MSEDGWNHLFGLIRAYSFFEEQKDSVPDLNSEKHEFPKNHSDFEKMKAKTVPAKLLSEEEMNRYIEQLNCTPKQALHEYSAFIRNIKSQKEIYLKCIDAELVKGDSSEYANTDMRLYGFLAPGWSLTPPPSQLSKLDYLKVFKEFILIDNEEILPESMRLIAYLKCNCKIP
jgi:hypothetical protein